MFGSASQNARGLTEGWVEHALFCPNCGAQPMARFAANRPVADFLCGTCREEYELKSQKVRFGARGRAARLERGARPPVHARVPLIPARLLSWEPRRRRSESSPRGCETIPWRQE